MMFNIVDYLGFGINEVLICMGILIIVVLLLIIIMIINIVQNKKLKKRYQAFMTGSDASNLEELIVSRLDQIDNLINSDQENRKKMEKILSNMELTYQKVGMVKYDAFNEMGGKLSFTLALLNNKNDGFIINAMHSREGCYTYIKEILSGNSIIILSDEEKEALATAMDTDKSCEVGS